MALRHSVLALAATALAVVVALAGTVRGGTPRALRLAGVFPTKNASSFIHDIASEWDSAFRIACDHVNADARFSAQFRFTCTTAATELFVPDDRAAALADIKPVLDGTAGAPPLVGVVGGGIGENATRELYALAAAPARPVPIVAYAPMPPPPPPGGGGAAAAAMPYLFSVSPSDETQGRALAAVAGHYALRAVATLNAANSSRAEAYIAAFRAAAPSHVEVIGEHTWSRPAAADLGDALDAIKASGAQAVLLSCYGGDCTGVLSAAAARGMTGAGWVWFGPTSFSVFSTRSTLNATGSAAVRTAMQGVLGVEPRSGHGATFDALQAEWTLRYSDATHPGAAHAGERPSLYTAEVYDAVLALAHAVKAQLDQGGDPTNGAELRARVAAVSFADGATGAVSFDATSRGPAVPRYDVVNVRATDIVEVGAWNATGGYVEEKPPLWPGGTIERPDVRRVVELAGLFPWGDAVQLVAPSLHHLGRELDAAFRIACFDVNENRDVVSRVKLVCRSYNVSLDDAEISATARAAHAAKRTVGIVGPVRSAASLLVAGALNAATPAMAQVSPSSTSPALVQPTYRHFFRTVPSDTEQAKAALAVLRSLGCSGIAVIGTTDAYAGALADAVEAEVRGASLRVLASARFAGGTARNASALATAASRVLASGARFIYVSAITDDALAIFDALVAAGARPEDGAHAFMGPDGLVAISAASLATHPSAARAARGTLATAPRGGHGLLYSRLWYEWAQRDDIEYPGNVHAGVEPTQFAAETYDAVFAFAHALAAVDAAGGDVRDSSLVRNALAGVNFVGTAGRVQFGSDGGPLEPTYDVDNLQGNEWKPVGTYTPVPPPVAGPTAPPDQNSGAGKQRGYVQTGLVIWPGGRAQPPACAAPFRIAALLPTDAVVLGGSASHAGQRALLELGNELAAAFRIACKHAVDEAAAAAAAGGGGSAGAGSTGLGSLSLECSVAPLGSPDDTADARSRASRALTELAPHAAVGALLSETTAAIAPLFGAASVPLVSPSASDIALTNTTRFPYLFRTSSPDDEEARAAVDMLQHFGFGEVAVLTADASHARLGDSFVSLATAAGIKVAKRVTIASGTTDVASLAPIMADINAALADASPRVVYLATNTPESLAVMQAAAAAGMTNRRYVWLASAATTLVGPALLAALPAAREAFQGVLGTRPNAGHGRIYERMLCTWRDLDPATFPGAAHTTLDATLYAAETYDAVRVIVAAVAKVLDDRGDPYDGATLRRALETVAVDGATGALALGAQHHPLDPTYDIVNMRGERWEYVATWDAMGGWTDAALHTIVWPGGHTTPPLALAARENSIVIAGLFPTADSVRDDPSTRTLYALATELQAAFTIACEHVARSDRLLRGAAVGVRCVTASGPLEGEAVYRRVARSLVEDDMVAAVVGPLTSTNAMHVHTTLAESKVPLVSPGATSVALNDKPYFFRTVPPDNQQATALADLCAQMKWNEVASLATVGEYVEGLASRFEQAAPLIGVSIAHRGSVPSPVLGDEAVAATSDALQRLRASGTRVIVLSALGQDVLRIMALASLEGMTGAGWVWIMTDAAATIGADSFGSGSGAVSGNTQQAMQGALALRPRSGHGALWIRLLDEWAQRDPVAYPGGIHQSPPRVGAYVAETYDAVLAVAHAADALVAAGTSDAEALRSNGVLADALRAVRFNGTTGEVAFDANGNPKAPVYDLVNLVGDTWARVGAWHPESTASGGKFALERGIVYPGGIIVRPADTPRGVIGGTDGVNVLCGDAGSGGAGGDGGLMAAAIIFALAFAGVLGGLVYVLFRQRSGNVITTA